MKIKITIFIFILSLGTYIKAQNLVINPSFEQHTQCPTAESQISYCDSWGDGDLHGTCDYYSSNGCIGNYSTPIINPTTYITWYQQPLSGFSFAGFIPYYDPGYSLPSYVEFLQGKFSAPLNLNQLYYVEFYVNAASKMRYFIHDISALITDTSGFINTNNLQNYNPQILPASNEIYKDTIKWMRIKGYYTAQGGENYITIGNYKPNGQELKDSVISGYNQTYYFIDSVGVYPVTNLDAWNAGPDKYINIGDSAQIGNPNTDYSIFNWITSTTGITYLSDSTEAHPWSKPLQTTTYYVTKTQGAIVFQDTVTVYVANSAGINEVTNNTEIKIYPNPANDKIHIYSRGIKEIKLFDLLCNEVISTKEHEICISGLSDGVYFIQVNTGMNIYSQKVIVQH